MIVDSTAVLVSAGVGMSRIDSLIADVRHEVSGRSLADRDTDVNADDPRKALGLVLGHPFDRQTAQQDEAATIDQLIDDALQQLCHCRKGHVGASDRRQLGTGLFDSGHGVE